LLVLRKKISPKIANFTSQSSVNFHGRQHLSNLTLNAQNKLTLKLCGGKTDNFTPVPDRWVSYTVKTNLGFSRVSRVSRVRVWIRVSVRVRFKKL